jgi:hypothetical protein
MKRFLFIFLLMLFAAMPAVAGDVDLPASGDIWDNYNTNQEFYGQDKPAVSDEQFEKAIEEIKYKQDKLGSWIKKLQKPRGKEYRQSNETEVINEEVEDKDTMPVICIPVDLNVGGGVLPVGHYQVKGEKDENGNVVLKLYQAQYVMAQFPATETSDDFNEDTITFVKWLSEGEDKIKLIYGSIDFNAYAVLPINQ